MLGDNDLSTLLAELDAAVGKMTPGVDMLGFAAELNEVGVEKLLWDCGNASATKRIAECLRVGGALVNAYPTLREAIAQLQRELSK